MKKLAIRILSRFAFGALLILSHLGLGRATDLPGGKLPHGYSYQHDEVREKPWSVHIVKIDLSNPELELVTTLGQGHELGLGTLSDQIRTLPPETGRAVAGINGDYYSNDYPYIGDPKGLQILRGELVSGPCDWSCFWMDTAHQPHISNVISRFAVIWPTGEKTGFGLNQERPSDAAVLYTAVVGASTRTSGGREFVLERNGTNPWLPLRAGQSYSARVREVRDGGNTRLSEDIMVLSLGKQATAHSPPVGPGTVLQISTATWPELAGVKTGIGGGPALLRAGKIIGRDNAVRHPRSALGWNKNYLFLVEVDGRQLNLSVGMTISELAGYMMKLGCEEAMSLDGGGSATCWVHGQVMNSPSEGRERPMANALVLVHKDTK